MRNCLIIDEMHPAIFPLLEEVGIHYQYQPLITKEEVLETISQYEGVIVRGKLRLDNAFFARASQLRFVARAGSGKDNIDVEEAERRGIAVLNSPEGNRNAVAEHAIGLMLNLLNRITSANEEVKKRQWNRESNRGVELGHQTIGIIGFGHTGQAVAKCLSGFGCHTLAYDINGIQDPLPFVQVATLEEIQRESDIITLHIPLDDRNRNFIDTQFIHQLAKPIWLINTARGEVIETSALIEALKSGKIKGAGLDVLENEKIQAFTEKENQWFDALAAMPQVVLTPHVAGWTHESYRKISEVLGEKICQFYLSK